MRLAHLASVFLWGGVILAETVTELVAVRVPALRDAVPKIHLWVDRFAELPLLAAVALTGAFLLATTPMDGALAWKIGAASGAIAMNVAAAFLVARRDREREAALRDALTRRLLLTAAVGVPLGAAALILGLRRV